MRESKHCSPQAYQLFTRAIKTLESSSGLLQAAVAISMHELIDADPRQVDLHLQSYADRVLERVHSRNPDALLAHFHDLFFEEEGFCGNRENYFDPSNSYLPRILERKVGLPITLSLIYKCVAERLGLSAVGINSPFHFMVGVQPGEQLMLIDPFHQGKMLTQLEAFDWIEKLSGQRVPRRKDLFSTASHPQWIHRILNNLENSFVRQNRPEDSGAMQELRQVLYFEGGE
jgi:regulator of sirC expression with transglutaminase-like and TPR domain